MLKPVCPRCKLFYKPKKNGVYFEEGMPVGDDNWKTYKLWVGDLHECAGCGSQVIVGVPPQPISEHFSDNHTATCERLGSVFRVDDC